MKVQWGTLPCLTGRYVYAEFTDQDLRRVNLDRADLMMLAEPIHSGADALLDAELIARRLEQQDAQAEETP